MAPLAPNSLVVIVGITGYIASHTGLQALRAGYRVRGTVRSLSKASSLRAAYAKAGVDASDSKLEFVVLDDLLSPAQFDKVFAGADGVIHLALPEPAGGDFVQEISESVLIPLRAAKQACIKRFVLTGTSMAVIAPGQTPDHVITDKDWNEAGLAAYHNATEADKQSPGFFFLAYAAGKLLAEREAWKYVETEKPGYELTVILPVVNWGPVLYGKEALTPSWITNLLKADVSGLSIPAQWYVDVRDTAALHVLSLASAPLANQRIWAAAAPFGWNKVLSILRKNFPAQAEHVPQDVPEGPLEPNPWRIDSELGRAALGGKWIGLEQSVVETARSVGF